MIAHFAYGICQHISETVIEEVECSDTNTLYQIDKDRVIVGGKFPFSIVNIDKCVIEKKIKDRTFGYVNCFLKLKDNKTIIFGCYYGSFFFYDMNTEEYKISNEHHDDGINDLLMIDDNTFLFCSDDKTIKVWKY